MPPFGDRTAAARHHVVVSDIGVPGSLDGPPLPDPATGQIVITFFETGQPSVAWPRIPGRTAREVISEAASLLEMILADDMLEKLGQDPPREPPL